MPLPAATDFTGPSVTEAQFKTAITDFRDHVANLESVAPGAILPFARTTAPAGWLKANGAAVSRSTYSALFAAIGTAFGVGDGTTTFNIPDLRGEFIRGLDDGRGVDAGRTLSNTSQVDQNKSHTHTTDSQGGHTHTESGMVESAYGVLSSDPGFNFGTRNTSSAGAHTHTAQASGGTESRPRNIALLACIKY